MRQPDRTQAQSSRRGRGDGQLRHREGQSPCARGVRHPAANQRGAADRLLGDRATGPRRRGWDGGRGQRRRSRRRRRIGPGTDVPAPAADWLGRAGGTGDRHGDGPCTAIHLLAVGIPGAGGAGDPVGRLPVPPRRVDEPQARHRNDGHANLDGHPDSVPVVAVRTVPRHRRHTRHEARLRVHHRTVGRCGEHLPRGGRGRHGVHPRRAVLREALEAAGRRRAARPARTRRQRRGGNARRSRGADPRRGPRGRRRVRGAPGREDRH